MFFPKIISKQYLDEGVLFRIKLIFIVFLMMLIILIYDIIDSRLRFLLAFAGILIGIGLGFIAGRMSKVQWHEQKKKVISKMDGLGVIILISYLLFDYYRNTIFGHWLQGATLTSFGFSILTGMMLGRFLSIKMDIEDVLKEKLKEKNSF